MHLADTELADRIAAQLGFVDYQAIDTGDGTISSITIVEEEDQCLRSNDVAAAFVGAHLADFEVERTDVFGGEVMVGRAADKVLHRPTTEAPRAARDPRAPLRRHTRGDRRA
jgi:hypothetical protein